MNYNARAVLRRLFARLASIIRRGEQEGELAAEIEAHLELATRDYISRGLSAKEARRLAMVDFGGVELAKEVHRDSRGLPMLETLVADLRMSVRSLKRHAALTLFAVLIIGLGVGASTVVFSVTSALLLRPLPFHDAERLVWIANGTSTNLSAQTIQVANLQDLAERSQSLQEIGGFYAFYGPGDLRIDGHAGPQRITGVPVTENFFGLLGVQPILGRTFTREEVRDQSNAIILSHSLWQSRFERSADVLGQELTLDGEPTTIIGVLPQRFDFEAIFTPGKPADIFLPYALNETNNRQGNTLALVGRLTDQTELGVAQAEATRIAESIAEENVEGSRNGLDPRLLPLRERISGELRPSLALLSGAVALLMLIVCANLSNLLLAHSSARRKERAIQVALGAGKLRLARRVITETLLLALAGSGAGLLLALVTTTQLSVLHGTKVPLLSDVRIDPGVVAFTCTVTIATGLLLGLIPALQAANANPAEALSSEGSSRASSDRRTQWFRQSLVVSEVALACMLLLGVGLLLRSLVNALDTELGFDTEHILAIRADPSRQMMEPQESLQYYQELLTAIDDVPGVLHAGLTDALPFGDNFGWRTWNARIAGIEDPTDEQRTFPLVRVVDPGYWDTIGLRLREGRFIDQRDHQDAERAVVINLSLADKLWPDGAAVGSLMNSSGRDYRVIGIVDDARYFGLERQSGPEMYFSLPQIVHVGSLDLVIRTERDPSIHLPDLRSALRAVDPGLPLQGFRTLDSLVGRASFERRSVLWLLAGFAVFGVLLASLGVYSVISYTVEQRRREMGIRLAFGATGSRLRRSIVMQTLQPAALGLLIGSLSAFALARLLEGLLYGVDAADPLTYLAAPMLLLACTLLASYLPARRASRLDVAQVLRGE